MTEQFLLGALASFILGVAKGGIKGLGVLVVSLMVLAFDAKSATGLLVPLLIAGDILAVMYFKKHVKVKYLWQFIPPMIIGLLVAVYFGNDWDEAIFKKWISIIILGSTLYIFWFEFRPTKKIIVSQKFSFITGFTAGFTTMIGNLAGPFSNLFFLSTGLPKNEIVGTGAWVFFIVNLLKLPFHIFTWETINLETFYIDLQFLPFIFLGFFAGIRLLKLFDESMFRKFLLASTALGALLILIK